MKKQLIIILACVILTGAVVISFRFGLGGNEDTWICSDGQWIKHGHPSQTMPPPDQCVKQPKNTNDAVNVNINTNNSETACVLITDAQECQQNADCLAIDYCGCTTNDEWAEKCGGTGSGCLCVMGGFHYCAPLDCANKNTGGQYYQELERLCTDSCCRSSVQAMQQGGYYLAPASGCGERMQQNQLKCLNSYVWCENASDSAVKINQNYGTKIVYENGQAAGALEADCNERGGRFSDCGDICAPGAEVCVSVCGYTCSDITE